MKDSLGRRKLLELIPEGSGWARVMDFAKAIYWEAQNHPTAHKTARPYPAQVCRWLDGRRKPSDEKRDLIRLATTGKIQPADWDAPPEGDSNG